MERIPLPQFIDESAKDDPFGLIDEYHGIGLPREGNMFTHSMFVPNCNMETAVITDQVWAYGYPDKLRVREGEYGRMMNEIFYSNAVRRLQAVEQLTLLPHYSTVPNTAAFSRFEHVWGSVLFVRQMAEQQGITGKEATTLELRTLVSDIAHTFGSHLGDWMFQGVDGGENQHDIELESYLEAVGINDIVRRYDFDPKSIVFPDVQDWVEASQPDLCVDRVDYALREMNRWNDSIRMQAFKAPDFVLTPENMLAMKDQQRARIFAEGYLLLSQENWSEPTHRFIEDMLVLRTKLFYGQGGAPRSWVFAPGDKVALLPLHEYHPRDLMYVTDSAQMQALALPDLGGHTLDAIMRSVALYRRQYVWPGRAQRIAGYMGQFVDGNSYDEVMRTKQIKRLEDPAFNTYLDEYPKALPNGFALLDAEEAAASASDAYLDFYQPPFKLRQIDPLVQAGTGFKRLSELDESYSARLEEHKRQMSALKVARLALPDPKTHEMLRTVVDSVDEHWKQRLASSRRMTTEELSRLIDVSATEIHNPLYPFMSFLDY